MKETTSGPPENRPDPTNPPDERDRIKKHFKHLRIRLLIGLLLGFTVPHLLLSAYFHFQFTATLKKSGKSNLVALAESQRNTIDLFLQERVVNIFRLFHDGAFGLDPGRKTMEDYLGTLRYDSDAFIDVGILDEKGILRSYAGPYDYLKGKDYSGEEWFRTLARQERSYHISDIYTGFRNKLHFTIAARQTIGGSARMIRATLDPDKIYVFLRTIGHGKNVDSSLVNPEGRYQVVDPLRGRLQGKSDHMPTEGE